MPSWEQVTQKNYTGRYKAAFFIIDQKWKHLKCPKAEKSINKCGISAQWNYIGQSRELSTDTCYNITKP